MEGSQHLRAREAIALIDAYSSETELKDALESLKTIRNKVLAHRQVAASQLAEKTATDAQVDRFMADMTKLIGLLSSIAHAVAYDPSETAEIYDQYAEVFWAAAQGKRTEGHPMFQKPAGLPE